MEDTLYWLIEYGKVFLGYGFLMFIWPLVVFRNYLRGKSVTFKFSFCVTAQVVIINTVVLMLGLVHLLNDWTLRILFYGTFLYSLREYFALTPERKRKIKYLLNGSFGWKNFFFLERRKYVRILEEFGKKIWRFYKKHWLEYSMLVVALVYGVIYFSWGVLHDRSYGFSDMYVHHAWIYQLSEGNPFSAGIYPEGMHCVVYALNALFGIRLYSCMLFISCANMVSILLAIYCLMKELFAWRYSAVIGIVILLTFGGFGRYIIIGMARLQCALPQEFAFPSMFICCLYLLRYLKGGRHAIRKGKETKGYWDENLLVFMLAFVSTIVIHFYATFMAFYLCLGVAQLLLRRIFTKERFVPLVTSVILGLVISVMPMVAGFVSGIPLQGSLYWAIGVMQNSTETTDEVVPEESISNGDSVNDTDMEGELVPNGQQPEGPVINDVSVAQPEISGVESVLQKTYIIIKKVWEKGKEICQTIYKEGYLFAYDEGIAWYVFIILSGVFVVGIFGNLLAYIVAKCRHEKRKKIEVWNYYVIILMSQIYMIALIPEYLGLPTLIDTARIGFILQLLMVMVMIIPLDMLFGKCCWKLTEKVQDIVAACAVCGSVVLIVICGDYHSYLYFELTRYDAVVQVTNKIIDALPEETFTVISPTEEIYQVIEYGWHEELIDFLEAQEKQEYTLPTEYVFLFVEKAPLKHAQYHFFDGPRWFAKNDYRELYDLHSIWPEYLSSEVSEEAAEKALQYYGKLSDSYANLDSRTIIQSKAFEWAKKFKEQYPNEMKILYEDDYFVCYYWQQNTKRLYNLGLK